MKHHLVAVEELKPPGGEQAPVKVLCIPSAPFWPLGSRAGQIQVSLTAVGVTEPMGEVRGTSE